MNKYKVIFYIVVILICVYVSEVPRILDYIDNNLHIYFLKIGHGDSILIKTPERRLILIDGGPSRDVVYIVSEILPFYKKKIDLLISTHSHSDHLVGLNYILQSYSVGCVIYTPDEVYSEAEEYFRNEILRQNIIDLSIKKEVEGCFSEANFSIKNFYMENLPQIYKDQNLESIISLVRYKRFSLLLLADATIKLQSQALQEIDTNIDLIKVSHQGSKYSFNKVLYQKLRPVGVFMIIEKNNIYGHPHKIVTDYFESKGISEYRTDLLPFSDHYYEIISDGFEYLIRHR